MSMYIKGLKEAPTALMPQESYDLINVDGVNKITFTGTPGASHVMILHYDGITAVTDSISTDDVTGTPSIATFTNSFREERLSIVLPNTNLTTAEQLRFGFYDAMSQAVQATNSLPYLISPDVNGIFGDNAIITSATQTVGTIV